MSIPQQANCFSGPHRPHRRGQALVEFAIISFVLTAMLMGFLGLIVMGLGSFQNNIASENAGRILDENSVFVRENFVAHFSEPTDNDFFNPTLLDIEDVTARQMYRFMNEYSVDGTVGGPVLYDESRLILSVGDWGNRANLNLPLLNQSLLGQYIFDPDLQIEGQPEQGAYRFPGAIVTNPAGIRTVLVPLLPGPNNTNGIRRTFHVESTDPDSFYPVSQDWVAPVVVGRSPNRDDLQLQVILFHPSQPASTIQLDVERDESGRTISQTPVEADDEVVDGLIGEPPEGYELAPPTSINDRFGASSSRGEFGLGESFAFVTTVRPFRAVFETSSVFRLLRTPVFVKYEADEDAQPFDELQDAFDPLFTGTSDVAVSPFDRDFGAYDFNQDQALEIDRNSLDGQSQELQRYYLDFPIVPPASDDNDYVENVFQLRSNDDGVWRVSVAVEFERTNVVGSASVTVPQWNPNHLLQLWLYKNGVRESLIATHNVTSSHEEPISITGQTAINADEGDVLQVRVLTRSPTPPPSPTEKVRLTGDPDLNWVSFERIEE